MPWPGGIGVLQFERHAAKADLDGLSKGSLASVLYRDGGRLTFCALQQTVVAPHWLPEPIAISTTH